MTPNSNAIFTLCSHLCVGDDVFPLEPREWTELADKLKNAGLKPEDIFNLSKADFKEKLLVEDSFSERIFRLIDRNASLAFELSRLENIGIIAITRADKEYPAKLKAVLGKKCPPLFYAAGDTSLLKFEYAGYVGSRKITDDDIEFTNNTVSKTAQSGYGVVSGGAKGVDTVSEQKALELGVPVVEYLSDSMLKKTGKHDVSKAIRDNQMLLLSAVNPDAGFNVGTAMMRNKFIYAQSSGTVVIRSEYNTGGTWAGSTDCIQNNWCTVFCRDKKSYQGNQKLIEKGAIPITDSWDGNIEKNKPDTDCGKTQVQMSLFD